MKVRHGQIQVSVASQCSSCRPSTGSNVEHMGCRRYILPEQLAYQVAAVDKKRMRIFDAFKAIEPRGIIFVRCVIGLRGKNRNVSIVCDLITAGATQTTDERMRLPAFQAANHRKHLEL